MDFDSIAAIAGTIGPILAVAASLAGKIHGMRAADADRNRVAELSESLGRLSDIESALKPNMKVSNQLLKEVELGFVEGVARSDDLSKEQIRTEVDNRMSDVRGRLEAIENRFPGDATIDKIASINDALFAQRIEQLSARIDKLEDKLLTKWDVALTVSVIVGGIFFVVGATYGVLKAFGHAPT